MSALLHSFLLVAVAEIGDKTQLLSILLAARFRCFWPIIAGILVATLINHGLTAWAGSALGDQLHPHWLQLGVSLFFIGIGLWVLVPDDAPKEDALRTFGAFTTSLITFFLAEMGDKTQLATLTLAAEYADTLMVIIGTTLGMLAANIPAIFFGEKLLEKLPLGAIRYTACAMFFAYGSWGLWQYFNGQL